MPLSADTLRLAEARRIALHAQGFADPRPTGRVDRRHLRRVLRPGRAGADRLGQRAHPLATSCPFLARLGPYPRAALADWLWGSGEVFEYWGHEASLLPVELHPLLRWRMHRDEGHRGTGVAQLPSATTRAWPTRSSRRSRERGPVPLGQLDHLGDAIKRAKPPPGNMWNWTPAKRAVEWLFWRGEVGGRRATRRRSSAATCCPSASSRRRCSPRRRPTDDDAQKALLLLAARSHGVGTARDLADYHRLNIVRSPAGCWPSWSPTARCGRWRWRAGATPPTCTPTPCCPAGCGRRRCCRRSTRSCGSGTAPRRCSASATASRSTCPPPSGCTATTCSRSSTGGELVGPGRPQGRPPGRRPRSCRGAYGEPGIDHDDVGRRRSRERLRELAGFLGLADVRVEPKGDLAAPLAAQSSGEDVGAVGGDDERVLELRGAAPVARDRGPAVVPQVVLPRRRR